MLARSAINPIFWTTHPAAGESGVEPRWPGGRNRSGGPVANVSLEFATVLSLGQEMRAPCRARAERCEIVRPAALDNVYNREDHSPGRPA